MYKAPQINPDDFTYELPDDRIARFPLEERDASRLLRYQDGQISHHHFRQLPELLGPEHLLFFNNTKVVPARIYFQKESGALIEIFLLHPVAPTAVVNEAMLVKGQAVWACTVGNLKRWRDGQVLVREIFVGSEATILQARLEDRDKLLVRFEWQNDNLRFVDILQQVGIIPLPPYLKRPTQEADKQTYQTVYSKKEGAVAAPTAGLHFTDRVLEDLRQKGVQMDELTLHVSAGTFQPIKVKNVLEHTMHQEQIVVSRTNVEHLMQGKKIVAVGTTSMRTLESLYWYGVKLLAHPGEEVPFFVEKLAAWQQPPAHLPDLRSAMQAIAQYMDRKGVSELIGETEIFIFPGYHFQVCDRLITNYHQPASTLILLVAAFIGEDWRKVYQTALSEGYRFLSYGDSSMLCRRDQP